MRTGWRIAALAAALAAAGAGGPAAAQEAQWAVRDTDAGAFAWAGLSGGAELSIACSGPKITVTLRGYEGEALDPEAMAPVPLAFDFAGDSGSWQVVLAARSFPPMGAWIMGTGVPPEMLEAFGAARRLAVRTEDGAMIGRVNLTGAVRARQRLRERCGI